MTPRITLPYILQHAIDLVKLGTRWEGVQINESCIIYDSEHDLHRWYSYMLIALKGGKANIPRPESTQRTMLNFGMYAQRLPNGSIFRPFPSGHASQWKWLSKAERMMTYKPMCPKTMKEAAAKKVQTAAKKMQGSFSLEVLSEAAFKQPEEEEMVYEEDADYSVGI